MIKRRFISAYELINRLPKIIKGLKGGYCYTLTRYSKPVGVLLSFPDYEKLLEGEKKRIKECKKCLLHFRKRMKR